MPKAAESSAATPIAKETAKKIANPQGSKPKASRSPLTEEILAEAFAKPMKRSRTPMTYRIGILLAAIVMVALVAIYLSLIALSCYGVYYHFANHAGILEMRVGGRIKVLLFLVYASPIVIGPIIIFFLIKPLLARPAKLERTRSLTRKGEPLLFSFVDSVCKSVGAPRPKRIDIDCDVNASAGFRRGLVSFLGKDLVLTIGLPLVAGLSLREFGGVLAHEFGHFAQGAGMRLSYLVRAISHWFLRVVYERDQWDESLEAATEDLDIRLVWIVWLAQLGVTLSRGILWVLMQIGMLVSGLLLRQMEFDADRYETKFAGHKAFASTSRKMRLLGLSSQLADAQIMEHLGDRRLVEDLPGLILVNAKTITPEMSANIQRQSDDEQTGWFDSHPSDKDRIAASKRLGDEGIFQLERPAKELLTDFKGQSIATTWNLYMGTFGPGVPKEALVSAAAFARASKSQWNS
ncbi:M48 family metallopeptidase [Adhaeretor mobilis]|nr:M48 family metallopeptidase [Adhaeretor mobilis]